MFVRSYGFGFLYGLSLEFGMILQLLSKLVVLSLFGGGRWLKLCIFNLTIFS
jgi:hypothetical protein